MKKAGGIIIGLLVTAATVGISLLVLRHVGPAQRLVGLLPPGKWQLFPVRDEAA